MYHNPHRRINSTQPAPPPAHLWRRRRPRLRSFHPRGPLKDKHGPLLNPCASGCARSGRGSRGNLRASDGIGRTPIVSHRPSRPPRRRASRQSTQGRSRTSHSLRGWSRSSFASAVAGRNGRRTLGGAATADGATKHNIDVRFTGHGQRQDRQPDAAVTVHAITAEHGAWWGVERGRKMG